MTAPAAIPERARPAPAPCARERPFRDEDNLTPEQRAILALLDRLEALEREVRLLRRCDPIAVFRSDAMRAGPARRTP